MMMLGITKNSSRKTNGGPPTSHLVRCAARKCAKSSASPTQEGALSMQEHPGIVAPAQLDRIAHPEQLGLTRRGIGQQRLDHRAVGQLYLVYADFAAIQQVAHHTRKMVLQFVQLAMRVGSVPA